MVAHNDSMLMNSDGEDDKEAVAGTPTKNGASKDEWKVFFDSMYARGELEETF